MLRHGIALALTMLAPVMTKERAVAMAEASVLPHRTEFQRRRWHDRATDWLTRARLCAGIAGSKAEDRALRET